jgi:hypothetical protein
VGGQPTGVVDGAASDHQAHRGITLDGAGAQSNFAGRATRTVLAQATTA